jgi:hypothetical protein
MQTSYCFLKMKFKGSAAAVKRQFEPVQNSYGVCWIISNC